MSHRCVHPESVVKMSPTCTLLHHLVQRVSVVDNIDLFTWGCISNAYTQKVCVTNVYSSSPPRTKCLSWRHYVRVYQRMFHQPVHSRSAANNLFSPMDTLMVYGKQVENFPSLTMGISCKQPAFTGIYPSTRTLVENNYSSLKNATIRCWTTIPYTSYYRFRIT